MPTTRPRHTITETPPVQAALDELRACMQDSERIDFAELVRLGAEVKARRLMAEDGDKQAGLNLLAEMVRTKSFPFEVDVEAADELGSGMVAAGRRQRLFDLLEREVWPQIPPQELGRPLPREEREAILGYGPEGV